MDRPVSLAFGSHRLVIAAKKLQSYESKVQDLATTTTMARIASPPLAWVDCWLPIADLSSAYEASRTAPLVTRPNLEIATILAVAPPCAPSDLDGPSLERW